MSAHELEVDITANPFAVIYGNDHHSFPSALVNARKLGVATVTHFDIGPGGTGVFREDIRLQHIHLDKIRGPVSMEESDWLWQLESEEIRREIPLPAFIGPIAFVTGALKEHAGRLNLDFFYAMKSTLREHPEIRLLVVPAGMEGRIETSGEIFTKINQPPYVKTHTLDLSPDVMHAASPGYCRAHTFCVCDWKQRSVT